MSRMIFSNIKKEKDFHRGIFVYFHQKLVVYYILDYFGIRDFQRDCFKKYSEGLRYIKLYFFVYNFVLSFFVNKY